MVCLTQHSDNVQTLINTVHNQAISGTHRMNRKLHSVVVSFAIIFASQLARAAPPVAKIEPFTTDYYGTPVTDDYRWMEVPNSKPLVEFMKGQDDYARSQLNSIPGRAELLKEISAADDIASFTSALVIAGGKYFYCQMAQGQNTAKVYMRDVASGKITLLVDPSKLGSNSTSEAVNFFQPSQDGRYLAYGISANGSEAATLRVIETTNLEDQNVAISRVGGENGVFLPVSWLPDNSFVYYRRQKLGPSESPADFFLKSRAWLHHLGQNPSGDNDTPIFGFGVDKAVSVAPNQDALVKTPPGSNYAFGLLTENESNNVIDDIFLTTTADLEAGKPVWKHIADSDDKVTAFDASGNEIFLITYKDAAHSKIVATDLAAPAMATARTVVPESDAIIRGLAAAKDALYVTRSLDSSSQIIRLAISNGVIAAPQVLALPYAGTVGTLDTNQTNHGAVFELESWTRPALWYKYDPETGSIRDTGLQKAVAADTSNLVAKEVSAVSYDGTMVPLSIIMKAGTKLDGNNPTILIGYGSYGDTIAPGFDASSLPWLNRGGITAIAHVRGGGWYGEDWHKAGTKLTKLNTILDFIACAQYLIDQHYTSQHFLAGKGSSAGGITIGGAITWRPDLFAVAIDSHGNTNTLRAQFTPNGPPNIREFGSISTRDGFHGLYAMSAYHHVQDGVGYPAVLLETGANDPRVEPWIVAKMAARLQAATSSQKPVILTVSYDTGHGTGHPPQSDSDLADETFMLWQTRVPAFQPSKGSGDRN